MKQPRNLQQKKTEERWKIVRLITLQRNFLEVTGNGEIYHYARNIILRSSYLCCSLDVSAIKNALLKHL